MLGTLFVILIPNTNTLAMKLIQTITLSLLTLAASAVPKGFDYKEVAAVGFRTVSNKAFKAGEELRYRLHYGIVDAGEVVVKVNQSSKKVKGRSLLHVVATGRSLPTFDVVYKVRDRYESYIDKDGLFPWVFVRRVNEGGYKINQDYTFFQHQNKVDIGKNKKPMDVPGFVQDMVSSYYYARTLDFSNAKVGDVFTITTFVDEETFDLKIKYMGKETIKLRKGKFKCMKFQPVVIEGRTFKDSEDLKVWITDDANRIPILVQAEIFLGSIKMEVVEYKNLLNPIAKVEK